MPCLSCKSPLGCLLAACLLAPLPVHGQTSENSDSDVLQSSPGQTQTGTPNTPDLAAVRKLIFEQTNQFRASKGRRELRVNASLSRSAQEFAEYLARTDRFSHTADGRQPSQRVTAAGYDYCLVAENIAYEYNSAGFRTQELAHDFMEGWKHSPEHRRNLLDPDLYDIGVGVAQSKQTGRYYAVQDFGRPKSKAITFRVSNNTDSIIHYTVGQRTFTLRPRYTMTHERCRPGKITFDLPGENGEGEVYRVRNGAHYTVRGNGSGGMTVERE
jgi:uncharacterized protein YkwD